MSSDEKVGVDGESTERTSSAQLSNHSASWESDTSEESDQDSELSVSEDKLIGSPGLSPISNSPAHAEDDHIVHVPLNENELFENANNSNNRQNSSKEEKPLKGPVEKPIRGLVTSDAESEAISFVDNLELTHLKEIMEKLRGELESERGTVTHLRKKLTQINKDKLGQTSQFNDEMSLLKCENVALQARVEEQAVHTEQLEYELTKARKKNKQDLVYSEQREAQDVTQIEDLKGRLSDVQSRLEQLEKDHTNIKQKNAEELHNLRVELESSESHTAKANKDIEITRTENAKLTNFIKEQEQILNEMLEKIQSTESELNTVRAEKVKSADELSTQKALTEEQGTLLQEMQEKCQLLTEELAAVKALSEERQLSADALESKSIQLECTLNNEKSTSSELRFTLEHSRAQLTELEERQAVQCRELSEAGHTLNRNEQELFSLKKQLQMEKEDKRDIVNKLKKQLDLHQEHVKKLRAELSLTNKHQKYMEEISQKIVNDLQPVFNGFPTEAGEATTAVSADLTTNSSEDRTRAVFDTLHNTVSRYKNRLTSLADEKMKAKAQCDSLTKESATYKEMLYQKEKAYDDCEIKLSDTIREMERVTRDSSELEARCATMTVDLETARSHNATLQSQYQSLNQQLLHAKAKYDKESDEKQLYLQHIYHLLKSDLDLTAIIQGQPPPSHEKLSWSELSTVVSEKLSALLNEAAHLREKVVRLESTLTKNESYMESVREDHGNKVNDMSLELAAALERSSEQWREERGRLEQHYTNIMSENQNRQQIYKEQLEKSQRNADTAWEKLRDSDEANRTLECEKIEVQEKIHLLEQRQKSLLCALALITGSYFPLLNRSKELREQRTFLLHQVNRFDAFKSQVNSLLQTLASEIPLSPFSSPRTSTHARLSFRKAVLAVLAVHRLQKSSKRSTICIKDVEGHASILCWATENESSPDAPKTEGRLLQWLCHIDLESVASLCTKDIIEAMNKHQDGANPQGYLSSAVTSGLSKMIRQLSTLYRMDDISMRSPHKYTYSVNTLSGQLLKGLQRSMAKSQVEDNLTVTPARSIVTRLQERVLNFVQQLHSSESERKRLKDIVESLNETLLQLQQYQELCSSLEGELQVARQQIEKLVPAVRLEDVMSELHEALEREKQAQKLLSDQSVQVKELTRRLDCEFTDRDHTEQSVKFAMKTLHDELDNKVTHINNLSRQVSALEGERQSLRDNIYDAESALKTAANDRQALANYVETLVTAFNKCREDGASKTDLSRIMLSGELIPRGHASPHLLSVQKLAHEFVDAYTSLQAKVAALTTVTSEQLHEMTRLKQELSLVCTGQQNYTQHNTNQVYQYPSSGYGSSMSPLKATSDFSSARHSPAALDPGLMTRSLPSHSTHRSGLSQQLFPMTSSPVKPLHISPGSRLSSSRGTASPRLQMSGNVRR